MSEEESPFDYSLRIVAAGDAGVGKTSFLSRYATGNFEDVYISTVIADIICKIVETSDGHRVRLQIWDTAGMDTFRAVVKSSFRDAAGALLFFALNARTSFEALDLWFNDIKEVARPDCVIVMIGNKSDLEDQRAVAQQIAEAFATSREMSYFEVSVKTGAGMNDAISALLKGLEAQGMSARHEMAQERAIDEQIEVDRAHGGCCG
jgi:small GTP-binding protein